MGYKELLILLVIYLLTFKVSGQESDTLNIRLKGKFEIGITPRFSGIKDDKISPIDSSFYHYTGLYRIQVGLEVVELQYLHVFGDYYRVRTDLDYLEKRIDAFGFGIQYCYKFPSSLVNIGPIRLYKKPITIRWFPEVLISGGLINLENRTYRTSGTVKSMKFHSYYQYGMAWNIYINKWANVSIMYLQEYFYSLKNDVYRYGPLQTKLVIKL